MNQSDPAAVAPPVAIVLYYLYSKKERMQIISRHHKRPRGRRTLRVLLLLRVWWPSVPRRGQGWRKGGDHFFW